MPRFLLANFADDAGVLWTYDFDSGKCWSANPRSTGFERDLYAVDRKAAVPDRTTIEDMFKEHFDGPGSQSIGLLLQRTELSTPQWSHFIDFVGAQLVRTPSYFSRIEASLSPALQESLQRAAKYDPTFRSRVITRIQEDGGTPEEAEELLATVGRRNCAVSPSRGFSLALAISVLGTACDELIQMRWCFFTVPAGEPDLILGDHAVMLGRASGDSASSGSLGLRNKDVELVLPLSRRMVAVARWDGPSSYGTLEAGSAAVVNERTLRYARRFIFAPHRSDQLQSDFARLGRTGPKVHVARTRLGDGLMIRADYA